ncbi:hypothetical protein [Phaeodactylibacter xiamenensis]|uniref:hypothetical protein n=1 Tax=Phaeodactylibacter xiamenensis TaxID=1524460 RepID=UPI0024A7C7A0|nr:hypothetical protein [Phaeodactylibacter xiamenensis]
MNPTISNSSKIFLFLFLFILVDRLSGAFLVEGLNRYFGLSADTELALVGHSHLMLSVDHKAIEQATGKKVAKYTRAGVNVADRAVMIDHLLEKCPDLELVIYGVDAWMFTGEGLSQNSHALFYPFLSTKEIDKYVQEKAEFTEYWQRKLLHTSRFDERLVSASVRGYLGNWQNFKYGTVDTLKAKSEILSGNFRKINSSDMNRNLFEKTLSQLSGKGIDVLLIYTPTIDIFNNAEPDKFREELDYFRKVARTNPNIEIIEYLNPWSSRYEIFFDPIHLNPKGQKIITDSLSHFLNQNYSFDK